MKRILAVCAIALTTACGKPVDVAKAVQASEVTSGWLAADTAGGAHKIVPSITVTLKNTSAEPLTAVQINAVFRLISNGQELSSDFRPVSGSGRLAPDAATGKIVLKASLGYTGTDPVDELLTNSKFVDAKCELFVKAGSGQWTRVAEFPIAREFTGP